MLQIIWQLCNFSDNTQVADHDTEENVYPKFNQYKNIYVLSGTLTWFNLNPSIDK